MRDWKRPWIGLALAWPILVAMFWFAKHWTFAPWIALFERIFL